MVFENLVRKGISLTFVIVISFFFSFFFACADEPDSLCEECKADYVPGETKDIAAIIITDKNCPFCTTQIPQEILKSRLPGIKFETIDYKEAPAEKLIGQYKIQTLPCFLIDPLVKEEEAFDEIKDFFGACYFGGYSDGSFVFSAVGKGRRFGNGRFKRAYRRRGRQT